MNTQIDNPYTPGTISHRLFGEIFSQQPIERRLTAAPAAPRGKRVKLVRVRATFAGTSRPNKASARAAVLRYIQDAPDSTATVEALEDHFRQPVRGFLQKLIEKGHLEVLPEASNGDAQ